MFQVQRVFYDSHIFSANWFDDIHVRKGRFRIMGLPKHRRGNTETTRQHKKQKKGKFFL